MEDVFHLSTLDTYLRLLSDPEKRRLLRSLLEADGGSVPIKTDDSAEYARLYHIHLPKLVDAGLIDWDQRTDHIVRGPQFDEIVPLLEAIDMLSGEDETEEGRDASDDNDDNDDN